VQKKTAGPILVIYMSHDMFCTRSCLLVVVMIATA